MKKVQQVVSGLNRGSKGRRGLIIAFILMVFTFLHYLSIALGFYEALSNNDPVKLIVISITLLDLLGLIPAQQAGIWFVCSVVIPILAILMAIRKS